MKQLEEGKPVVASHVVKKLGDMRKKLVESTALVQDVINFLVRQLSFSIKQSTGKGDLATQYTHLQEEIVSAIELITNEVKFNNHKLETMELLLESLKEDQSPAFTQAVANMLFNVAQQFESSSGHFPCAPSVLEWLLKLSSNDSAAVRYKAQNVLNWILSRGKLSSILVSREQEPEIHLEGVPTSDSLLAVADQIRAVVLRNAELDTNQPLNLYELWRTLAIMLCRWRNTELVSSLPAVFQMQSFALDCASHGQPHLSAALHQLVVAYLLFVANLFQLPDLDNMALKIKRAREEAKQNSPCFSMIGCVLKLPTSEFSSKHAPAAVTTLFDKKDVIAILGQIKDLDRDALKKKTKKRSESAERRQEKKEKKERERKEKEKEKEKKREKKKHEDEDQSKEVKEDSSSQHKHRKHHHRHTEEEKGEEKEDDRGSPAAAAVVTPKARRSAAWPDAMDLSQFSFKTFSELPPLPEVKAAEKDKEKDKADYNSVFASCEDQGFVLLQLRRCLHADAAKEPQPLSDKTNWDAFVEETPLNYPLLFPCT
eukprot:TRINITY_DN2418_c0_g1_i1.p1 TRINITY_DN2418_c0_g1~~TRINITY_DN2418_c0_g1_i1.p1  ORF type:complete len:542 (+),score=201.23 TRINITY_DN2418_c0_g1_i1:995-2620(+)